MVREAEEPIKIESDEVDDNDTSEVNDKAWKSLLQYN